MQSHYGLIHKESNELGGVQVGLLGALVEVSTTYHALDELTETLRRVLVTLPNGETARKAWESPRFDCAS